MADITLSSAVRDSLLTLQKTSSMIERTNSRLSTGLKVASAIDDAVAFFQAKALSDRAGDFTERKDAIDQAISSLTAANDGVNAVDSIVRQLKGIAQSAKSASSAQLGTLLSQFNDLRDQLQVHDMIIVAGSTGGTVTYTIVFVATCPASPSTTNVTTSALDVNAA